MQTPELATIRNEIKAWERAFKDANGRAPSVGDVKDAQGMETKYKLYKKLVKASQSELPSLSSHRTAPRTDPRSTLLPKARAAEPTAPLAAYNPFSPQKKQKGIDREPDASLPLPRTNLFGTSPSRPRRTRTPSPDPFPPLDLSQPWSAKASPDISPPPSQGVAAVSRARKRLRGEPVSPSPYKEKKRRVTNQTVIPFFRNQLGALENDTEIGAPIASTSFVDDSPVKARQTRKFFNALFLSGVDGKEDAKELPLGQRLPKVSIKDELVRKPSMTAKSDSQSSSSDSDKSLSHFVEKPPFGSRSSTLAPSDSPGSRSSTKRPISDEENDLESVVDPDLNTALIPPSPTASGSVITSVNKQKSFRNKKRVKRDDVFNDASDDDMDDQPKIVTARNTSPNPSIPLDEYDFSCDPVFGYTRSTGPPATSVFHDTSRHDDEHVEVDLPDKLRRVLALEASSAKSRLSEEERLVRGVLYGKRIGNYDPKKGGEIWDVGEEHQITETETYLDEEDWEGEPVPWEVGEL